MNRALFTKAYYIKLGMGGMWEKDSIGTSKVRIGWSDTKLKDVHNNNWDKIKQEIQNNFISRNKTQGATQDFNALKNIYNADKQTIFITFYDSKLWWCKVKDTGIKEDKISKYREVLGKWSDKNVNGKTLLLNDISGTLAQLQRFSGTCCNVKEIDYLKRLINAETSNKYNSILKEKNSLTSEIEDGIKSLHWKDFEILVELIFRQITSWRRTSVLGEELKFFDFVLEEPINGDLYGIQVKSKSSLKDFKKYADQFSTGKYSEFRKLYFIVHSPEQSLRDYDIGKYENVELILPKRLAKMIVDGGLIDWLMKKIQ